MPGSDRLAAPRPALILLPTLEIGGSERKFVRTANALAQRGLPVHLAYFNPPEELLAEVDPAVEVVALRRRGKYSIASLRRLVRHVSDRDVGAVVGVNFYPLSYMAPAARLLGGRDVSWVSSINTTRFAGSPDRRFMFLNAPLLRRMDRIVFGCESQLRHWVETYRLPPERALVVYNGVDTGAFRPGAAGRGRAEVRVLHGFGAEDFVVICVGMLRAEKGQLDLVEALGRIQQAGGSDAGRLRLLLIGDGPLRPDIEQRVDALGLNGRVVLTGVLPDVRAHLDAADAFVLPSHSETFSNAALEAAAMGLPLLLSDVDGNRELVEVGNCGLLFESGNPDALAEGLVGLMSDEARSELGARAQAAAASRFSLRHMVDAWASLLWPTLADDGSAGRAAAGAVDAPRAGAV